MTGLPPAAVMTQQRGEQFGGFALGLIVGLLVGLALALAVALYVTKVPVPFVNKVPQRTAEHDAAEAEKNKGWDPNAPLATKPAAPVSPTPMQAASAASAAAAAAANLRGVLPPPTTTTAAASAPKPTARPSSQRDPAAILAGQDPIVAANAAKNGTASPDAPSTAGGAEPFVYFVQVGAFASQADAEQQRARVGMMGLKARISEREQAGRTMYRVRLGPFNKKDEATSLQDRLAGEGLEAALVRVEKTVN
jgi:cell division protein FtsN